MNGFTLIELAVALSIMTILVAVMLPRMLQLQRVARIGNLKGLHGSVSTASLLVHLAAVSRNGQPDTAPCAGGTTATNALTGPGSVCTKAGLIATLNGYPSAAPLATAGIVAAVGLSEHFSPHTASKDALAAQGYRMSTNAGVTTFARADAKDPDHCSFTYTQAADARASAAISIPVVYGC